MAESKKTDWSFRFERTPYGVKIVRPKGKMPEKLKGFFTDELFAQQAIDNFRGK